MIQLSYVVAKLKIRIDLFATDVIAASSKIVEDITIPEFLKPVNAQIKQIITNSGFESLDGYDTEFSRKNGGFSMYDRYILRTNRSDIRLYLDVRLSDHSSKPDLKSSNQHRISRLEKFYKDIKNGTASAEVLDIYCKDHDWGVQIFVGDNENYNKPVTSFEAMNRILAGKLNKLVRKYS